MRRVSGGWTVTPEPSRERPYCKQRTLWVVRKDGRVYGKRHRTRGKAERFVEKMKGAVRVSERFDVVAFENLTDHVEVMTREAEEGGVRDAAGEAADAMLLAAAEIRRLQAMEDRVFALAASKRAQAAEDLRVAKMEGLSTLGVNLRTISANHLDSQAREIMTAIKGEG
jgi:uncharacterized protein YjbJ (UPF0337 family)